ncbi:MAG TPA: M1 family metallopeptidase [Chitinophagaceae bacterium]|nr:M1 family metallopeptidase [Chitinophagaceae bacterium]
MKKTVLSFFSLVALSLLCSAQPDRWQQRVRYTMNIDMDVEKNQYAGKQRLEYWNNSPDTLKRVFYHLYFNAFQPNSMMDVRSQRQGTVVLRQDRNGNSIVDWDPRVKDRIAQLKPEETGYQKIRSLKMDGRAQTFNYHETILEVVLDRPILPKSKVTFDMEWDAQVPLQVRRSGRDNPQTGVRYTMTQWYPKLAEYDYEGWHPTPYVGREFYGVWGDYDVTIHIDKRYIIGGTGYLQNAAQVGYGYEPKGTAVSRPAGNRLTWKFTAPNVHDFAWAADPDYKHITRSVSGGPVIHVLYRNPDNDPQDEAAWNRIADAAVMVYPFIKKNFGEYPYKQYSFIHGGDGGMEYPMSTMLVSSSLGTAFHEWMHTWYQMLMGTNESLYAWMDEGFTEYATNLVEEHYRQQTLKGSTDEAGKRRSDSAALAARPLYHAPNYQGYLTLAKSGKEEPMTIHADHFNTNYAYSNAAYSKGAVFLEQLGYITGAPARDRILQTYYRQWRFKHPNVNDFLRIAEQESGLVLDWYRMYFVNTTRTIDYGIDSLWEGNAGTNIRLRNLGQMPMPLDVKVTFKDGTSEWHYIPMYLMFGAKPAEEGQQPRQVYESWKWTHPTFEITSKKRLTDIVSVEIDPSYRMADVERKNNKIELKF